MNIIILNEWAEDCIKALYGESETMEVRFRERLKRFNYRQTDSILRWIKGQLAWNKSKLCNKIKNHEQAILLIDQMLFELNRNRENLKNKPNKHSDYE